MGVLFAGTSGFSYPAWRGSFYPDGLPPDQMLAHYARRLNAVEVNNTFYRMPTPEMLAGWAATTPEGFQFAIKAPRSITHIGRLTKPEDKLKRLGDAVAALGTTMGPVLFQLPPHFKSDPERLRLFLGACCQAAPHLRVAMEFRHASWDTAEVQNILGDHGATLCEGDRESSPRPPPFTLGAFRYLRMRRTDYRPQDIRSLKAEICCVKNDSPTYVFFKHEDGALGPAWGESLLSDAGV